MAIDTETKRRSVLGYSLGLALVLPVADSSIALGDKIHVAGLYSGLAISVEAPSDHAAVLAAPHTSPSTDGASQTGPSALSTTQTSPAVLGGSHT